MHLDYDDPIQWLSHRFACDAAARHAATERQFLDFFAQHQTTLRLVDLGSGTGANFRYYFERIPHPQSWTLIEQDPALSEACRVSLRQFADERGYTWEEEDGQLRINKPGQTATVSLVSGRIEQVEQLTDLTQTDAITANAVFDLLSFEQFDTLVGKLIQYEVCLLATLNYYETSFLPFAEEDHRFLRLYHTHMKRPQPFGMAMGADCSEEMLDLLEQHPMAVAQGGSQWHLKKHHSTMHHYLLHFMENALHELNLSAAERQGFDQWFEEKRQLSRERKLEIIVDHSDIFAYPR